MKYLKVFTDFAERSKSLSDTEIGRLFRGMMEYASSGIEPDLRGNERYIWDSAKVDIDNQRSSYDSMCAVNKKNAQSGSVRIGADGSESERMGAKTSGSRQEKEKKRKDNISLTRDIAQTPFASALEEFKKYRRQLGKKLTPLAETKLLNELERLAPGDDATKIAILDQSICNGWTGVFPLKGKKDHGYQEHPSGNLDALLVDLDAEGGEHDASAKWSAV